ncbi:MAG TPA: ribonuclease H-like domain-containing protein [Chitinophagales bacterium]
MILHNDSIRPFLFLDIETVPFYPKYEDLDETWKALWQAKHRTFRDIEESEKETYENRAGIYAEFGKVICISLGYFHHDKEKKTDSFRVKSFYGDDEKMLLNPLVSLLKKHFSDSDWQLCGHNIREFDIPYLCRRILANCLELPQILDVSGRKPWEMNIVDTMQQWRFGDYKNYTSLQLIAAALQIPSPKQDIEGKDVARVYWQEKDLQRIMEYCQRDVITVARILLKFKGETGILDNSDVVIV